MWCMIAQHTKHSTHSLRLSFRHAPTSADVILRTFAHVPVDSCWKAIGFRPDYLETCPWCISVSNDKPWQNAGLDSSLTLRFPCRWTLDKAGPYCNINTIHWKPPPIHLLYSVMRIGDRQSADIRDDLIDIVDQDRIFFCLSIRVIIENTFEYYGKYFILINVKVGDRGCTSLELMGQQGKHALR